MDGSKATNVKWHSSIVTREDRELKNGHRGAIIWFTGLSGAGKSTLAHSVEKSLFDLGCHTFVLDGDNVRHGLCADLGFSECDRSENIRRIGELCKILMEAGVTVLAAFISPIQADRERVRNLVPSGDFYEFYCKASVDICESRDVKGLYKRARAGEIKDFTGISASYDEPINPELVINTGELSLDDSVDMVMSYLSLNNLIDFPNPNDLSQNRAQF